LLGKQATLPPLDGWEYLAEIAIEIGLYETSWQEMKAWSDITEIKLQGYEAAAIMRMSHAYTSSVHRFEGKDVPQPWYGEDQADKKAIAQATKKALRQ
jgi:hypothetical protein